ncbi:MAG: helix-turn-helix transcriptional regulator [Sphaerochaeta sp.]
MKTEMNDAIVDTIRMVLRGKNLSQKELARDISMTEATMSKTLHKTRAITIDEIDEIAKVLKIPVHTLYNPIPLGCKEALSLLGQVNTKESEKTIQKLSILAQRILFYKDLRTNTEHIVRVD